MQDRSEAAASPSRPTSRPVAVVTGASGGVGRATAVAFAEAGFDVAVLARGEAGLRGAAEDVRRAGGVALCCPVDVSDAAALDRVAGRVEDELGPIDVWVNSAMTTVFAPFTAIDPVDFQRAVEVTFLGQVWGTRAALARMVPRDRGTIVNVGSALAYLSIPLQSAYCASKFASRGFVQALRSELAHEGSRVRLTMVHLPGVNTPQFDWCKNQMSHRAQPVAPIYQPELAARTIVRAAVEGRRNKVLGVWNTMLVAASQLSPAFSEQYAALAAWGSQLTDTPMTGDEPSNLHHPVDGDVDHGARGRFGDRAKGMAHPSFLASLPTAARQAGVALVRTVADTRRRSRPSATRRAPADAVAHDQPAR
ncbi:MAG: SDR family oxidoreductase [Acidimicrobiales bacterium]